MDIATVLIEVRFADGNYVVFTVSPSGRVTLAVSDHNRDTTAHYKAKAVEQLQKQGFAVDD